MGQTVNLLAYAFGGSNPSPPTVKVYHDANRSAVRLRVAGSPDASLLAGQGLAVIRKRTQFDRFAGDKFWL